MDIVRHIDGHSKLFLGKTCLWGMGSWRGVIRHRSRVDRGTFRRNSQRPYRPSIGDDCAAEAPCDSSRTRVFETVAFKEEGQRVTVWVRILTGGRTLMEVSVVIVPVNPSLSGDILTGTRVWAGRRQAQRLLSGGCGGMGNCCSN